MPDEREAYRINMQKSYEVKTRGLEIKINTMELLYKQVELLAEKSKKSEGNELLEIQKTMAMLGQAIIPD